MFKFCIILFVLSTTISAFGSDDPFAVKVNSIKDTKVSFIEKVNDEIAADFAQGKISPISLSSDCLNFSGYLILDKKKLKNSVPSGTEFFMKKGLLCIK